VTWCANADLYQPHFDVFARRYDAAGAPQGAPFRVNTYTTSYQTSPKVAFGPDRGFVVVWESFLQDGSQRGIFGQRFDAAGLPQGAEFPVNTYRASHQIEPAVAFDTFGDFVVVWSSYDQDGSHFGVFGRRFRSTGLPLGPEFRANAFTPGAQSRPVVAPSANGGFVVVWEGAPGALGEIHASVDCSRLYTVEPCRVADTRTESRPLAGGETRLFPVSGLCNVPADARGVVLNVTAVNPTDVGNLRLFPAGLAGKTSVLNFTAGLTRSNNAVATLGRNGEVAVRCDLPGSTGGTHLVLDVFGYFKR
jgi:hypothetical protein